MASKPIRGKDGKFAGSVGSGTTPPTPAPKRARKAAAPVPVEANAGLDILHASFAARPAALETEPHFFEVGDGLDATLNVCPRCGRVPSHEIHSVPNLNPDAGALRRDPRYRPYEEAVWDWAIDNGGIRSYYGGVADSPTIAAMIHLRACGVDANRAVAPRIVTIDEFGGTDSSASHVEVSACEMHCNCGAIRGVDWVVKDEMTLPEIVFSVVRAGDQEAVSVEMGEPTGNDKKRLDNAIAHLVKDRSRQEALEARLRNEFVPEMWRAVYAAKADELRWHARTEPEIQQRVWQSVSMILGSGQVNVDDWLSLLGKMQRDNTNDYPNWTLASKWGWR